ncbi:MAG: DUF5060 domain-containing protein [Phycisphaerae bacterium]|nr:DUF5060 domain-containing protein [Phycisphaerae bacterium]NIP54873.1 DUF5060 domain-containing protein [Phycisphaerae bacterium]NIS52181.1 DUF5060 domain-containing protein [Phycisphaerae bacterium]NIU11162.1 DUF5060 domain-containing protein [Phycisphaerae bacterium]NIU56267.1 DUF5060 domain-containing protein [Phycisphaerae bacterium]
MRQTVITTKMVFICLTVALFFTQDSIARRKLEIQPSAKKVGKYEKLEILIKTDTTYENPYNPDEVDLTVTLKAPKGKQISLPAFYFQDYERRKLGRRRGRANWYYPIGRGLWKARFATSQTGSYSATATLKDNKGTIHSNTIKFDCTPSSNKGFIRAGRKDPRFFEFTEGDPFFAIGQNLAFIGEGQYVNLTKAEQIFEQLSNNGANFLRIWTCCQDWAMAIEAGKSAWDRSWHRRKIIVPIPGGENNPTPRKCVKLEGDDGVSLTVSPSHPVALRPDTSYVLTGRFMADGPTALRVNLTHINGQQTFDALPKGKWQKFKIEFTTGQNVFWLGRLALSLLGNGSIWLDNLSLKEATGGPELLWEADVNRPIRGVYNQLDCFMLDKIIESAELNGIYLMLCLITRDLYINSLSKDKSPEYQQAVNDAKKFMRYAVARWGYSTSVAVWEYFNEMDPGKPTDRFYTEVGDYLRQIDPYNHLRTTSTWHPSARDCRHPDIDIGQLHHYMRPGTKENYKDEVAVIIDKTAFLREHSPAKPALIGEFGLATPKWGLSDHMKQDTEAVHFHNSLWASAFAGSSGTAMFWWWDQLDRQNAYGHYKPLADFLEDVSFANLRKLKAEASDKQLHVLGYQGSDRAYLWLFNQKAAWSNIIIEKNQPAEIKDLTVTIKDFKPGNYNIEWWNTRDGSIIQKQQISPKEGKITVSVPPFSNDIACKIRPY